MQHSGKRKIIIIGPAYPYRGGPSTFVSYIYHAVKERFDVSIYNYKLLYPGFLFPGTTQYDKSKEKKFIVPSRRIVNSINPFNWAYTAGCINKENPDLVIFDWWHPFFGPCHYSISSLIKKSIKVLFITENFISHEQNKADRVLTKIGLCKADAFIALSHTVESDLAAEFSRKKIYRSELPSFDLFHTSGHFNRLQCRKELNFTDDQKVLLFFGYVRKYKGLDILLEAMPAVLKQLPEARLLIAGEFYDNIGNYTELISRLSIDDKVTIVNKYVPNEAVGKYYSAADVNVLPYRSATQSAVLNVSYSFRIPVVASAVGGLSEFIADGKTGIIVEPGSSEALANGIIEFFKVNKEVNFEKEIAELTVKNRFSSFPELLNSIIDDLKD